MIQGMVFSIIESKTENIRTSKNLLDNKNPKTFINMQLDRSRNIFSNIQNKIISISNAITSHNENLVIQIENKNINNILRKGFVYMTDNENNVVSSKSSFDKQKKITIHFADGSQVLNF